MQHQQEEEEGGQEEGRKERRGEGRKGGMEVDLFFAHDSTVLPVVALLDLIRVGGGGGREEGRGREERGSFFLGGGEVDLST